MDLTMIPCVMGLPTIDQGLQSILEAMQKFPKDSHIEEIMTIAKAVGCCIALGVGANECYKMMLGKSGMDVMKLIHILIISLCITWSGTIVELAKQPGLALENLAYQSMQGKNFSVMDKEQQVAKLQSEYLSKIADIRSKVEQERKTQEEVANDEKGLWDKITDGLEDLHKQIDLSFKQAALWAEQQVTELLSIIFRFMGEVLFQMSYFGMLVAQRIFLCILGSFAPLMFALSLSPHFKSAWSQWLSKYLSISLWGYVTYMVVFYVMHIMEYYLDSDIANYSRDITSATVSSDVTWENVGALGMQGLGTTCMYVIALMIGVYVIRMVPEVASWLIPGGVSSAAGSVSGEQGMSMVKGATAGAASKAATVVGAYSGSRASGGSVMASIGRGVLAATPVVGGAYRGAKNANTKGGPKG